MMSNLLVIMTFQKEFYLTKQFIDGKLENLILNSIDKKTSRVKSKADDKK